MPKLPAAGAVEPLVHSLDEVAVLLREPRQMVRSLAAANAFPHAYKGGRGGSTSLWRIPRRDVDEFMARRAAEHQANR